MDIDGQKRTSFLRNNTKMKQLAGKKMNAETSQHSLNIL